MPATGLGLAYSNYTGDDILMAQMQNWIEERLVPQIFNGATVLKLLAGVDQKDRMTLKQIKSLDTLDLRDGGASIDIPMLTTENDTVMSFEGYQQLNVDPQTLGGPSFVQWREYAVSIAMSRRERLLSKGSKTRVFKLQEAKELQAEMSLIKRLDSDLLKGDQSQASLAKTYTTDLEGLSYFLEENPAAGNTVAGVARAAGTSWHYNKFNGTSQVVTATNPSFASVGPTDLDLLIKDASRGQGLDEIDVLLTTTTNHSRLIAFMDGQKQFLGMSGDPSFNTVTVQGKPVIWSKALDALGRDNFYGLQKATWSLTAHEDSFFQMDPYDRAWRQAAERAFIYFMGNLICKYPAGNFVYSNVAA